MLFSIIYLTRSAIKKQNKNHQIGWLMNPNQNSPQTESRNIYNEKKLTEKKKKKHKKV